MPEVVDLWQESNSMYVREPVNDLFARLLSPHIYIGMVRLTSMIVKITIRMTIILDNDNRRALGVGVCQGNVDWGVFWWQDGPSANAFSSCFKTLSAYGKCLKTGWIHSRDLVVPVVSGHFPYSSDSVFTPVSKHIWKKNKKIKKKHIGEFSIN